MPDMKSLDLKNLNFNNLAIWPLPLKVGIVFATCILVLVLAYFFDTKSQLQQLVVAQKNEQALRLEFETKANAASDLDGYRKQLQTMNETFASLLRQLPNSTEVPNLLEDITKLGVANGLQFQLFKPLAEKKLEFFVVLPIQISVIGNYHQLAQFITQTAALDRIVTWHDFNIEKYKSKSSGSGNEEPQTEQQAERLVMNITAQTYRYLDEKEKESVVAKPTKK